MVAGSKPKPPPGTGPEPTKPPSEPRVFVMTGDRPISEISDISGFPLPAKCLSGFGRQRSARAFLSTILPFLVVTLIAEVSRGAFSPQ